MLVELSWDQRKDPQSEDEDRAKERALREQYLRLFLTSDARERLANVRMVRPEIADQVENYILQLGLAGKIRRPIDDDELREILSKLTPQQREIRFKFI
ncbi:DNA-binding protein MTH1615 [Conexivisphaera calida]|uniref:DNA-binding protein MTH1615 n=1 Tax=Conexivisphaera calida TaxID=1874277 RepID=A0A4P2VFN6_9ARCH|nr:DNA-binding protein MTH1615 [Conexivisphaera calida]